jgi:hypothetical protein
MVCSSVPGGGGGRSVQTGVLRIVISCSSGCSPAVILCNVYRRTSSLAYVSLLAVVAG